MEPNTGGYPAKRSHKTRWIVIALVIILVLVINATWGWLYSNKRSDFNNKLNSAQQTAKSQKEKTAKLADELAASKQRLAEKDNKPETQSTTSDYREIPELGVKYKLDDETKELTYSYTGSDSVGFSTPALIDFGQQDFPDEQTCFANNAPIGSIVMYEPGSMLKSVGSSNSGTPIEQAEGAKKVGSNYFVFSKSQAACTKNHTDVEQSALKVAQEAFSSLVPID